MRIALLLACAGCWTSAAPAPAPIANEAPVVQQKPSRCPPNEITGQLFDSVERDEPLIGATVVVSGKGMQVNERRDIAITDENGHFTVDLRRGHDRITVYYSDVTFISRIPAEPCDLVAYLAPNAGGAGELVDFSFKTAKKR